MATRQTPCRADAAFGLERPGGSIRTVIRIGPDDIRATGGREAAA